MQEQATENLKEIKISDVIEKVRSLNPGEFNKMIIDSNEKVNRSDYFFVKYNAISAQRESLKLTFPVYTAISGNMSEITGGEAKHGELALFPSEKIIEKLSSNYQIDPEVDPLGSDANFSFPLEETGGTINPEQRSYFISDRTYSEQCNPCTGNKLVTCDDYDCEGKHNWPCVDCNAKGVIQCHGCGGAKRVDCDRCNGSKKIRCSSCGGDGKKVDTLDTVSALSSKTRSNRVVKKKCGSCSGKGQKPCTSCNGGKVTCSTCSGAGKLTCSPCGGHKSITCTKCYGDKERYGLIDCPQCKAQGEMGYISFVRTTIHNHKTEKLFARPASLVDVSDEEVMSFANKQGDTKTSIVNINSNKQNDRDDYVKDYAEELMSGFGLSLDNFNKLLKEDTYYQVVPCVQIQYKHMLTNETLDLSIIDFFGNAKLKFHKEAEEVSSDLKDKGKKLGRFFGKLFKTKKFKAQDDKKKEIKLMIYLAKADGKIEEEEKGFLAESINSIEGFTSTEKSEFFNLMNDPTPPALTKEDVTFSSKEKLNEVVAKLTGLAGSDGDIDKTEQELLNNIMALNE